MLTSLHIENLAVVKTADLNLTAGFTVLSGETGAGKSMILDAVHLLMGARADKEQVRTGAARATVCGMFEDLSVQTVAELKELGAEPDEDGVLYLQRTVEADGKSKTVLNGRPIPLALQKEIGLRLMNIHGQHDSYALLTPARHKEFLDRYADDAAQLESYRKAFSHYHDLCKQIADCQCDEREKERRGSMLRAQIAEIEQAKLKSGEEEALTKKRTQIRNAEKMQKQARTVYRALYENDKGTSAYELLAIADKALAQIAPYLDDVESLRARLEQCQSELMDVAVCVQDASGDNGEDPTALLDRIEGRLELFRVLQRKYGADNDAVMQYAKDAKQELSEMEHAAERLADLTAEQEKAADALRKEAEALHRVRAQAAEAMSQAIMQELAFLEMAKVRFAVKLEAIADLDSFTKDGSDQIEFLVATNTGEPLRPLSKIASGGELSRIMLAIQCVLAGADGIATLVFDEIDTGVSGKTAQKVGEKLRQTAKTAQVLCVTHAAQIAGLANTHILVSKADVDGRTQSTLTYLTGEARVDAIAAMMGGAEITESVKKAARELLLTE